MNRMLALSVLLACLSAGHADAAPASAPTTQPADLVPLKVKVPMPGFDGAWMQLQRWKHERPDAEDCAEKLPLFLMPRGTRNLALYRPVTSSDRAPFIGTLDLITDGHKENFDAGIVELADGHQWVQIDLGHSYRLYAVLVWHDAAFPGLHKDVIVQLSDDERFEEGVQTIFNNDRDNSSGLGRGSDREYFEGIGTKVIDAHGLTARYIRLHSNGGIQIEANQYVEVEVHGLPDPVRTEKPSTGPSTQPAQ